MRALATAVAARRHVGERARGHAHLRSPQGFGAASDAAPGGTAFSALPVRADGASRVAEPAPHPVSGEKRPRATGMVWLQPKLTVGPVGDPLEREADHVAEQVLRMPNPRVSLLQRCPSCSDEEEVRRAPVRERVPAVSTTDASGRAGNPPVTGGLEERIDSARRGGEPLLPSTAAFFGPRFGFDFGAVRVHTDAAAGDSVRAMEARAYTVGHDIVFAPDEYRPATTQGRRLLAHELAHVVQQAAAPGARPSVLQRADADPAALPGLATSAFELEAMLAEGEVDVISQQVAEAADGEVVMHAARVSGEVIGSARTLTVWAVRRGGTVSYAREFLPGQSELATNQAFIAVADRPLENTELAGLLFHYSLQYWQCGGGFPYLNVPYGFSEQGIRDTCRSANPTEPEAKKLGGMELLQETGWRVWAYNGETWEVFTGSWDINLFLGVSVIHLSDTGNRIMPILSDEKSTIESMWTSLQAVGQVYPFAELDGFGSNFVNWPRSMYRAQQTNSNTFVRTALSGVGITMTEMQHPHPGHERPVQNAVEGLTFSARVPPWPEGTPDPPMPTFIP